MGQLPLSAMAAQERDETARRGREGSKQRPRAERDEPLLPDVTRDEREAGWGDEPGERSLEWYRRERPPHHE